MKSTNLYLIFCYYHLAETLRLEDQPLAEDQQALLAEFERRRRVRKKTTFFFYQTKMNCY